MEKIHENTFYTWKHENMHVFVYFLHLVPTSPPPHNIIVEKGLLLTLITGASLKYEENSCMLMVADMSTSLRSLRLSTSPLTTPNRKSPWMCRSCTSSMMRTSYQERSKSVLSCLSSRPMCSIQGEITEIY